MPTLLLRCANGFMDSAEGVGIDTEDLKLVGKLRVAEVGKVNIADAVTTQFGSLTYYFVKRGMAYVYKYAPNRSQPV